VRNLKWYVAKFASNDKFDEVQKDGRSTSRLSHILD
jgi:hypothetical protein